MSGSAPTNANHSMPDVYWARFVFGVKFDNRAEGSETAIFRLLNGPGYRVKDTTEYTITILNAN